MQFEGQEEPVEVELDSELEDGATTVSFEYDGHTYEDVELAEEFTVEPAVESVSAITAQTVDVEFNMLPEDLSLEDFTITEEGDLYNEVDVESMASTNGNIKLELADALSEDTTYELVYSGGEEAQTMDFTYEKAMPTAVNILTNKVATGETVQLKSEVMAGDDDVTADHEVTYSSDFEGVEEDGTVDTTEGDGLDDGDTFLVRATVGSGEDAVESELEVVVAEDSMADSYQFFTINGDGKVDSDLEEADAVTSLDSDYVNTESDEDNKYVVPYVQDQFGELVNNEFQFESLDPETMLVDENSGEILGVYDEGTADVKITAPGTNFEQTVSVDVQAPAMADSFELSETSIDTVDTAGEQNVTVTVMDQYGETYSGADVSASSDSDAVEVKNVSAGEDGEATITLEPVKGESGEATVEVQVGDLEAQNITVNVEEAGSAVNYDIMNSGDDLTYDANTGVEDTLEFEVFGVDENGNQTTKQPVDGVDFTVEDSEGNTDHSPEGTASSYSASDLPVGEYTLTASKNDFDYGSVSFEVIDTTPHLSEVSFDDTSFDLDDSGNIYTLLNEQGVTKYDQFGNVIEDNEDTDDVDESELNFATEDNGISKSDIKNVTVANTDVVEYTGDELKGVGNGETTVNVEFNTVDENGEWGTQTVAFDVQYSVDTEGELKTAISNAAATEATDTITLGGDIEAENRIIVNESVTINGNGNTVSNDGSANVFRIASSDVSFNNINVDVTGANQGFHLHESADGFNITESTINGDSTEQNQRGIVLSSNYSGTATVSETTIDGTRTGIFVNAGTLDANNNSISNNQVGIAITGSATPQLSENEFVSNVDSDIDTNDNEVQSDIEGHFAENTDVVFGWSSDDQE